MRGTEGREGRWSIGTVARAHQNEQERAEAQRVIDGEMETRGWSKRKRDSVEGWRGG
jgi:hypothetical protein